jgi:hypothetical protein
MTIEYGANQLGISEDELERLVEGARQRVIAQLGEGALEAARRADHSVAFAAR